MSKVCESCQQHPATNHWTIIRDGESEIHHLCTMCSLLSGPSLVNGHEPLAHGAQCNYCGDPADFVGIDSLAVIDGGFRRVNLCVVCSREFNRYTMHALHLMPKNRTEDEQLEALRHLRGDVEQHMKQWVSENGPQ